MKKGYFGGSFSLTDQQLADKGELLEFPMVWKDITQSNFQWHTRIISDVENIVLLSFISMQFLLYNLNVIQE